jgi:hypothetical protein
VSLTADSLKKALTDQTFKGSPEINLLKNLGQKSKPTRLDSKEVKKFVLMIVVPASILFFLLVTNPFAPKPKIINKSPLVVEIPTALPTPAPLKREVVKPPPDPPVTLVLQKPVPKKIPEKRPVMEPGMKEILLDEVDSQIESIKPTPKKPKPVQVELKELMDSPPAPIKIFSKPPVQKNKTIMAAKKQEQVSQPSVKKKTKKIVAKKIKKPARKQVTALPKKQKKVIFPATPKPKIFYKQRLLLQQSNILSAVKTLG